MINFLLTVTILLFSFGQLGRISFFDQQINIYLYEIGVVLILSVLFFKYKVKVLTLHSKLTRALIIFIVALLFSFVINLFRFKGIQNIIAGLFLIRLLMYLTFIIYLFNHRQKTDKLIILFTIITIFVGIIQYFLYPDLRNLYYDGWDPHLYRVFGQFFDTSLAGAIYGLLFIYFIQKKDNKHIALRTVFLITLLLFVVLTFSRSLYLAFILTSVIYLFINNRGIFAVALMVAFFLLVLIAPKPSGEGVNLSRIFSINSRISDYKIALELWKKQPIFGYGYNHIRDIKDTKQNISDHAGATFHSSFLNILITGGVVGFAAYLFFLYQLFWARVNGRYFGVFLIIMSCFDNVLLHPFILFLTIILLFDKSRSAV